MRSWDGVTGSLTILCAGRPLAGKTSAAKGAADMVGISRSTAYEHWSYAKVRLKTLLDSDRLAGAVKYFACRPGQIRPRIRTISGESGGTSVMPANLQKARELFLHAVGKLPPEQWDDYVAAACGGDTELEQQVRRYLQVHRDAGSFLESPAPGVVTVDQPVTEGPGTVIGPYKLLEQIGEGGFGVVFMAEQTQPVRRKVAFKVLKPGMDTRQVVARFEAERQGKVRTKPSGYGDDALQSRQHV
jgi:hypothetical protein